MCQLIFPLLINSLSINIVIRLIIHGMVKMCALFHHAFSILISINPICIWFLSLTFLSCWFEFWFKVLKSILT